MTISDLLIIAASTWWTSYVLTSSDGPGDVFAWLREHIPHGRHGTVIAGKDDYAMDTGVVKHNGLLDCPVCLSIWVAVVFVLAPVGWLTYAFAAAGVAMLLHGYTGWKSYG